MHSLVFFLASSKFCSSIYLTKKDTGEVLHVTMDANVVPVVCDLLRIFKYKLRQNSSQNAIRHLSLQTFTFQRTRWISGIIYNEKVFVTIHALHVQCQRLLKLEELFLYCSSGFDTIQIKVIIVQSKKYAVPWKTIMGNKVKFVEHWPIEIC